MKAIVVTGYITDSGRRVGLLQIIRKLIKFNAICEAIENGPRLLRPFRLGVSAAE